jgi:hypothetical protein
MFNTTFKNISVTTFVAEIGVPTEIHRPVASHVKHLTSNEQMMDQKFVYVVYKTALCHNVAYLYKYQ